MLVSAYRMKILKREEFPDKFEIKKAKRNYRNHKKEFLKVSRRIRNMSDYSADIESLKNGLEMIMYEISRIYFNHGEIPKEKDDTVEDHE